LAPDPVARRRIDVCPKAGALVSIPKRRRSGVGDVLAVASGAAPRPPRVLHLGGDLDVVEAPRLGRQLREHVNASAASVVILDLSAVSFMDSAGLDPLEVTHAALAADDRLLVLQSPSRPVKILFHGLDKLGLPLVRQTLDEVADVGAGADETANALQDALGSRTLVNQAEGLLMGWHDCDARQAGLLLELIAAHHDVSVLELAAGLADAATRLRGGRPIVTKGTKLDAAVRSALGPRGEPTQSPAAPAP
jgi:anti-anti-sigma factor